MEIGKRIASLRQEKHWTTNRLANQCGLSQSFLRSVELGEKGISVESLGLICDALGISLQAFFRFSEGADPAEGEALRRLDRLTPRQKQALFSFLDAMSEEEP